MRLELLRICTRPEWTAGVLVRKDVNPPRFLCATMEDTYREVKVKARTRIPAGTYRVKLRNEGNLTRKYADKFPDIHRGMLWLQNVPNFEYIYIHLGNTAEDSEGCILVGNTLNFETGFQGETVPAYKSLYTLVANQILNEDDVEITIKDIA
jgi:hypothetical protein